MTSPPPRLALLIATANAHKARELGQMLLCDQSNCFDWFDLTAALTRTGRPGIADVPETGETFLANACQKAAAYARHFQTWALADDSGLEVDALQGRPGVRSARWAADNNAGSGDAANNTLLLRRLASVPDEQRSARFVCVLALADPAGRIAVTSRGTVEGRIAHHPRGQGGFGYDPLFLLPELDKTTAELPPQQKNALSHRGRAVARLRQLLPQLPA